MLRVLEGAPGKVHASPMILLLGKRTVTQRRVLNESPLSKQEKRGSTAP